MQMFIVAHNILHSMIVFLIFILIATCGVQQKCIQLVDRSAFAVLESVAGVFFFIQNDFLYLI